MDAVSLVAQNGLRLTDTGVMDFVIVILVIVVVFGAIVLSGRLFDTYFEVLDTRPDYERDDGNE